AKNNHELLGFITPIAFEMFNFDSYDLVISVTSESAKGIITKPSTLHICYCLTPTRYLWSGYDEYLSNPPKKLSWIPFYKIISKPLLNYAKKWDLVASSRPDYYVAISTAVKNRIKKYYGRDSEIIYPPVETDKFKRQKSKVKITNHNSKIEKLRMGDFFLIVSRLVPYKKVDLAIEGLIKLGKNLIVVGTGSEEEKYKTKYKSNKNIIFKGFVTDDELAMYYRNAKAFIYPQEEDFGITAVEAQAAGIPVIAYKKGGVLDTIIDGKTGILFNNQSIKSLSGAVLKLEKMKFEKDEIVANSAKFSEEKFEKEILDLMKLNV
ncbi:MAG TPA: glycosyltransferase, partial [Patescibacteria group bacterium]|nr:glycosyltransferase [Patescibacteria group bacterium]